MSHIPDPNATRRRKELLIQVEAPVRRDASAARPRWIDVSGAMAPAAPESFEQADIPLEYIDDLLLKTVYLVPHFTADWVGQRIRLARSVIANRLEQLMMDRMVEVIGQESPLTYRWAITDKGRQRAMHLLEICAYTGPAPVSVDSYVAMIEWQCEHLPNVTSADVQRVTQSLVLPPLTMEIIGLAAMSRRSLFLYGPPGNGKTTIGHLLHQSLRGEIWIPHAILVGNDVIRVFDPQVHEEQPLALKPAEFSQVDQRWVRIKRPFIAAAGELQLHELDLSYSAGLRFYEAPLSMKANGGVFLLDDIGYQRANPFQLLNRWVFPLEHGVDFLMLKNGQKVYVPFRQMLVISTNLDPDTVMEPAILRRIGYRLYVDNPTADEYTEIFHRTVAGYSQEIDDQLIEKLIERHLEEDRPLHGCVPRDLVNRVADICRYRGEPFHINETLLDLAWLGYYGANNGNEQLS
ncbi:MAG: hypothetical protein IT445_11885 [Phycisphaeraceae bacterium]|nr:hypothetical protein [Phycisphaeraceae bacterium]